MAMTLQKHWLTELQLASIKQGQPQKQPTKRALGLQSSLSAEGVGRTDDVLEKG